MQSDPEIMSQVPSVDGQSPRGLINTEEAMRSVKKGGNLALVVTGVTGILAALAADFHLWYDGPLKGVIGMMIGAALVYYKARTELNRYADQGPTPSDDRD